MSTEDAELPRAPAVQGPSPHLLVVRAPYYREVVDGLSDGAARILREAGATHEVLDVAGAFELPQAIRIALRAAAQSDAAGRMRFDGYVALGCVVRGETDHYEYICREAMAGLMNVALAYGIALGTGLLTVDTVAQALARARPDGHNKGAEAAAAALRQIDAARRLGAA
jgi:6,7-dimethyl-8-ribityllumazine synthase